MRASAQRSRPTPCRLPNPRRELEESRSRVRSPDQAEDIELGTRTLASASDSAAGCGSGSSRALLSRSIVLFFFLHRYLGPDIVIAWFLHSFTEILCGQQYYGMDPSVCALDPADDFVFSCNSIGSEIQTGKSSEKYIVLLVKQSDRYKLVKKRMTTMAFDIWYVLFQVCLRCNETFHL